MEQALERNDLSATMDHEVATKKISYNKEY